jgi:hypothetical protein
MSAISGLFNPILTGGSALVAGNLMGSLVDRVVVLLMDRANQIKQLQNISTVGTLIEALMSSALQVGLLSLGISVLSGGLPWITSEPSALILFALGIFGSSKTLQLNLDVLNAFVFDHSQYTNVIKKIEGKINMINVPTVASLSPSTSNTN